MLAGHKLKKSFIMLKDIMKDVRLLNEIDSIIEERCPDEIDFWCSHHLLRVPTSIPSEELLLEILAKESAKPDVNNALNANSLVSYFGELAQEENGGILNAWKVPALRILSNLSQLSHGRDLIKNSKALSRWIEMQSLKDQPSIFLEAWKIIHNLQNDETLYLDRIYSLVPPWDKKDPVADIILIHGIKGGAAWTWRQHDEQKSKLVINQDQRRALLENDHKNMDVLENVYTWLWPLDWLTPSLSQSLRFIAIDYPAYWWKWSAGVHSPSDLEFDYLCKDLLEKLKIAGVGSRPIIWITHSMGGLVAKNILHSQNLISVKDKEKGPNLANLTCGIVFLSVPHFGSPLVTWSCRFSSLFRPSSLLRFMKIDSPKLSDLNQEFVEICSKEDIQVLSILERLPSQLTQKGPSFIFVPKKYGDLGIGEMHEVDATHLDICKPYDRSSQSYILIKDFISKILNSIC